MTHRTVSDEAFLATALDLFRTYGFDGVSLKMLADETGLEKASLYYRYPGGKNEIVMAVVKNLSLWVYVHIVEPLKNEDSPNARARLIATRLKEFYAGGSKGSLLDTLSIPTGDKELQLALRTIALGWLDSFTLIARGSGCTADAARSKAEEALVRIEGSLVLARVSGETGVFERTLKQLPKLLTSI